MDISQLVETPLDPQKKPYWQVLDEYHRALQKYPALQGTSVPEFAENMGPAYSAGQGTDNALRRGSANIDIALHHFGGATSPQGPSLAETLGGPREGWDLPKLVGGAVKKGTEQLGGSPELATKFGQVGESAPRMAVDLGVGLGLGGVPGMAGMSALSTYGETGSKTQAAISGATAALMPTVAGRAGEALAAKVGGKTIAEAAPDLLNKTTRLAGEEAGAELGQVSPPTVWQNLARVAGAQAGMLGLGEASETAQILAGEGSGKEKIGRIAEQASPSSIAATAFSQLPWTAYDLVKARPKSLEKTVLEPAKQDFADRFTKEYTAQQGVPPEPELVKATTERVVKGKDVPQEGPIGNVLASMGNVPIEFDTKRPLKTTTGEWPISDAVQSVTDRANLMRVANPNMPQIGSAEEPRIIAALRGLESSGVSGKVDRDELSRQAASRVIDTIRHDTGDLSDISPSYRILNEDEEKRLNATVAQNRRELEIASNISPHDPVLGPEGGPNPNYNPQLHSKIALISGTPEERAALAGHQFSELPQLTGQQYVLDITPKEKLSQPIVMSARDSKNPAAVVEIKDNMLNQIERDMNTGIDNVTGKPKKVTLTADATMAARRAAAEYAQPVDLNNPASVRGLYEYVKAAVKNAQLGFDRLRGPETNVVDGQGKTINYSDRVAAELAAAKLNDSRKETEVYLPRKNPNGTYRVSKAEYARKLSLSAPEEGSPQSNIEAEAGWQKGKLGLGGVEDQFEEEGIPQTTLSQFHETLAELERNQLIDQVNNQNKVTDPAIREARKASLAQNVVDYVKRMSNADIVNLVLSTGEGKETPGEKTIAKIKARFVKTMQFLRDGGDLQISPYTTRKSEFVTTKAGTKDSGEMVPKRGKTGNLRMYATGNLESLNQYLGEHGLSRARDLNSPAYRGLSWIEQFHVLSKHLAQQFVNPSKVVDFVERPRGDFGFMPHGFEDDIEKKVYIDWPKGLKKSVFRKSSEFASFPEEVVKALDRSGKEQRFESDLNPLATLFVKATKHQLTVSAGELTEMFRRYAPNTDKTLLELAGQLTNHPFGSQVRIGFGFAKDTQAKGYYHYGDDHLTSTGILLSPYSGNTTGRYLRSLDRPEDVLPHFVHELAHAHTVFGYFNDPAIKAEVDEIWRQASDHHKAQRDVGAEGKFTVDAMHGLDNPLEMMATVFHDPLMQEYLKGIPDNSVRGGRQIRFGTVFDRIMDVIRRVFAKIVGDEGANTLLQRVTDVTQRTMQAQENLREHLGIQNRGDIYAAKYKDKQLVGDLVENTIPQKPGKPGEVAQVYPMDLERGRNIPPTAATNQVYTKEALHGTPYEKFTNFEYHPARMDLPHKAFYFTDNPKIADIYSNTPKSEYEGITEGVNDLLTERINKFIKEGKTEEEANYLGRRQPGRIINTKLTYDNPREIDMKGKLWNYDAYNKIIEESQKAGFDAVIFKNVKEVSRDVEGTLGTTTVVFDPSQIEYLGEKPGQVLGSRVPKQPLVDSMKAASEYVTEDENGLWFKPISVNHFKATFGPVFGDRLTSETHGDQEGFRTSPVAFTNVTDADLALAPKPPVRTWAPSAFEMMKGLFVKNGETPENAEALAGYNLSMASLLKGTENAVWGKLTKVGAAKQGELYRVAGAAFMPEQVAGLPNVSRGGTERILRHEQTHLAGFTEANTQLTSDVRESIRTVNSIFDNLSQDERDTLIQSLTQLTNKTGGVADVYDVARTNPNEFASEFMGHVGQGLGNAPNANAYVRDLMRFTPDEVSSLLMKTTLRRAQALDGLKKVVSDISASRGIADQPIHDVVDKLAETFRGMGREAMDIALDQADFYRMRNLYPDMYQQMVKSTANVVSNVDRPGYVLESRVPKLFTDAMKAFGMPEKDERLPQKISWWNKLVAQMSQFADDYPIARPFTDMMFASKALQNQRLIALHLALGGSFEGGRALDTQITKQIAKFALDEDLRKKLDKVALDVQTEGDENFDKQFSQTNGNLDAMAPVNIMTPEFMDALYRKYGATPEARKSLEVVLNGMRNQIIATSAIMVDAHTTAMDTIVAKAIQKSTNLLPEPSRETAKLLRESIQALEAGDQQKAVELQNQFMSRVPDYNVAEKLYNMVNENLQGTKQMAKFLELRMPYFMSEKRTGGYGVWWRGADDKIQSYYLKSEAERSHFIQSKNIEPIRQTNPGDTNYGVSEDIFKQLNLIHDKVKEKLTDLYGEKDAQEMSTLMDFASELRQALGARNALDISTQRKGAKSRENLDMFDTHLNYVYGVVTAAKNRQMKLEADLLLDTPQFRNQPVIKEFLQRQLNTVMSPDTKVGKFVSMVNFVYYMGMNLSSMILEPFQQISAMAPILTRSGASIPASYSHLAWGNKLAIEAKANKGKYKDAEINNYMERLRRDGVVDYGIITEMDHNTDLETINRIRAVGGLSLYTPFEMFKNRVYQAANLARRFYGQVPAYNSEVAALAAYKHLKSQGLSGDALVNEASNLVRLAMFGGGKENRPGLFQYAPRSAAQAMWSLQSYNTSMMSLMGRMIKDSTFNPKGLTPAQTAQTRKAAVQMLATQFTLAGALGFPFVQIGILALQKLFPEHNIEGLVRDFFNQFNGDDDAMGGFIGNALSTGTISALSEAPDMGSRFALSSAMGVSPYSGISADNVIGPTASIAKNVFGAIQAGANGDPMRSVEQVMPKGILRIWKALEQGSSFVSPYTGAKTVDNLSPVEQFGRAVGFTPARVARIQDAERLSKMSEAAANVAQQRWADQQSDDTIAGLDQSVHQAIAQRSLESKGTRTPVELARAIAKRVEEKTLPVDTRSFGNKQTIEAQRSLKGVLGEQSSGPSNTDRIMLQQSIAQRLGIPRAAPSQQSFHNAGSLDMLLNMYPHLTKPQAALLLHHATATSPIAQGLTASGE